MNNLDYFEEKRRYLDSMGRNGNGCNGVSCLKCILSPCNTETIFGCSELEIEEPEIAKSLIFEWAKKNPRPTNADVFYEKYPNGLKNAKGIPFVNPCELGLIDPNKVGCDLISCSICKERYWNMPYKKENNKAKK